MVSFVPQNHTTASRYRLFPGRRSTWSVDRVRLTYESEIDALSADVLFGVVVIPCVVEDGLG